jgi:hypothetical protein
MAITGGAWFTVPGQRWALVTLGASGTLLLLAVTNVAFPIPNTVNFALVIGATVGHVIALTVTRNTPPIMTVGDPPGRMLRYVTIQSASHAIRYRVPFPQPTGDRMRVRLILARPYAGSAHLLIDISGRLNGTMVLPADGNLGEREYTFDKAPFGTDTSVVLTITPDSPDQDLRIAAWRSGLGRMLPDEPKYVAAGMGFSGLPEPATGQMIQAWPMIWVTHP